MVKPDPDVWDDDPDAWHNQPTPKPKKKRTPYRRMLANGKITKFDVWEVKYVIPQKRVGAFKGPPAKRYGPWRRKRFKPESDIRPSPSQRDGARWKTITVPEETHMRLKELAKFYKKPIGRVVEDLVLPAFKKAYEESMTLARIEANRQKEKERVESLKRKTDETQTPDDNIPPRRTHF
jgi:hypothetical protein